MIADADIRQGIEDAIRRWPLMTAQGLSPARIIACWGSNHFVLRRADMYQRWFAEQVCKAHGYLSQNPYEGGEVHKLAEHLTITRGALLVAAVMLGREIIHDGRLPVRLAAVTQVDPGAAESASRRGHTRMRKSA